MPEITNKSEEQKVAEAEVEKAFGKTLARSSSPRKRREWRWCSRTQRNPANREKCAVTNVKPFQVWDVRENRKKRPGERPWSLTSVLMRSTPILDMPRAPYVPRIFKASWSRMKGDRERYRFVRGPK